MFSSLLPLEYSGGGRLEYQAVQTLGPHTDPMRVYRLPMSLGSIPRSALESFKIRFGGL